jgi:hypothetical protein
MSYLQLPHLRSLRHTPRIERLMMALWLGDIASILLLGDHCFWEEAM